MKLARRVANAVERRIRPYWHAGGAFECSVCGHAVRSFRPLDAGFRSKWRQYGFDLDPSRFETLNIEAYSCPFCSSTDRDRLCALYLKRFGPTASAKGLAIEFAPSGPLSAEIRRNLQGWQHRTADLFMKHVDDTVDICDMREIYGDGTVDFFICSHVLEHVRDDSVALSELYRILRPGGQGILMVPLHLDLSQTRDANPDASEAERWRTVGQGDHARLHCRADFVNRIERAGFELQQLDRDYIGANVFERNGIASSSVLYVGLKAH